jgi:hypothetical protein
MSKSIISVSPSIEPENEKTSVLLFIWIAMSVKTTTNGTNENFDPLYETLEKEIQNAGIIKYFLEKEVVVSYLLQ